MSALITAPGMYPDLSPEAYFAEPCPAPALTNSLCGTLLATCPAKAAFEHPAILQAPDERASTAAQYRGQLVHRLALGRGRDFVVLPFSRWDSKEAKQAKQDAEDQGLIPVKETEFAAAEGMADRLRQNIADFAQGHDYQTEVVFAWQRHTRSGLIWCRGMLDLWVPALFRAGDVKTWACVSDARMEKAFGNSWARQNAFYDDGLTAIHPEQAGRIKFEFLAVEPAPPFLARTGHAGEASLTVARSEIHRAAETFGRCLKTGEWPGYGHYTATPTPWATKRALEAELEELDQ